MSRQHIQAYRRRLDRIKAASGSLNEGPLSDAFRDLLDRWGASAELTLVPQWEGKGPRSNDIRVDGALVPTVLRIPFGYWEAKDSKDVIRLRSYSVEQRRRPKVAAYLPWDAINGVER